MSPSSVRTCHYVHIAHYIRPNTDCGTRWRIVMYEENCHVRILIIIEATNQIVAKKHFHDGVENGVGHVLANLRDLQ